MIVKLNRGWEFCKEGKVFSPVSLPHDAMLGERRSPTSLSGEAGAFFPGGKYRYQKKLTFSSEELNKDISLLFEGVYRNAEVFVNGIKVGAHKYGYSEFTLSLNGVVRAEENLLEVTVDNSLVPNCRWYSGAGIYRPVWLIVSAKDAPKTLRIVTRSTSPAVIEVTADEGAEVEIYDGETLVAKGGAGEFTIPDAKLWSAETPHLYTAVARRGGGGTQNDVRHPND